MEKIFNEDELRKELKIDAKGIGIPSGAAEIFINHIIKAVKNSIKHKQIITKKDLERTITKELEKYNADFAYVYKNRDKII